MKRYRLIRQVSREENMCHLTTRTEVLSSMERAPDGEYVRWSDVEALREELESQIPAKQIEKLQRQLLLVHQGKCPECERPVRDYKAPFGSFAPEAWASMREVGIDPNTGHKAGCKLAPKS